MKLRTIFCYEFAYLMRRTSTKLYAAVLLLFTFVMNGLTTPGDGVYANNTFHITATVVMGSLLWLVMGATIAGEAAARDVQTRMHPLTYTTPVTKLHYLGGRFLSAFAVNALLALLLPVGVLLSYYLPGMDEGGLLPFRPWAYGSVYLLIALPCVFMATALQFAFAALSRQVMTSYIASLLLAIFAQIIAIAVATLFGNWNLVRLLDPVGVTGIVGNELQTWTATQKNTRLVSMEGLFLWNRVLWGGVAAGLLWFTYARFRLTQPVKKNRWLREKRHPNVNEQTPDETSIIRATAFTIPQVQRRFGFVTYFRQAIRVAWTSFSMIAKHPAGLTLVGAVALVSAVFGSRIMTQFGILLLPTTGLVIDYLAAPVSNINTPFVVMPLLILFFAGELVWKERAAGLSDLTDTTPVPEWALLLGKFLGLGFVIVVWMVLLMAGSIGMQWGMNYAQWEIGLYVKALFGLQLIDYLLFALLALVIHVVVNKKTIAYLVALLVFSFVAFPSTFGIEHKLLIFGADSGWAYSDMRGFGQTIGPWLWYKLYWIAWSLLLAVAAKTLWARGREHGLKSRLLLAKSRFTRSTAWVAAIGAGLLLTAGGFIFYHTNVLNEYLTGSDSYERKAEYERRYGKYRAAPQPRLTATKLHVEIYPDRQQMKIRAAYTLVNTDTVLIDTIHIGTVSGAMPAAVTFSQPAAAVVKDKELGHHMYALAQPLRPGDSLQLNFVITYQQPTFLPDGTNPLVVKRGTSVTNHDLLPSIGYQRHRELNDAVLRKKYSLVARPAIPSLYDAEDRKKPFTTDQAIFEAVIGTASDEMAIAPGRLLKSWAAGNRRYFHYKTDAPIGGEYAILSGNYSVQETTWNDVAIRVCYYPDHARNIDRMLRSVKASLAYFTANYGPYPYKYFTLVERAGSGTGASADAGIIYYGEQYSLLNPDDGPDGFDLPYYIMAHEVAHQWWGMARLSPAHVEGAGVLIEGLAVYAGMQVLEKTYGDGHLRRYIDYLHSSYQMPRSLATPSLLQANEDFLYYRKGGLALYALSRYVGKEKVNGALRHLLQKRTTGELTLPTTLDLYGELQKITPDSLQYLLHDFFKENTYWRLKTSRMTTIKTSEDSWQVTLQVQAQKVVVDPTGAEKEVPMNDWLEIGLYEEGKGLNEPLYLQMHRIRSGEQTINITVPQEPDRGGIDPNHLMIDLRLDDNMKKLAD